MRALIEIDPTEQEPKDLDVALIEIQILPMSQRVRRGAL